MAVTALIWGVMSPICKLTMQLGDIGPIALSSMRLVGAALLFWLVYPWSPRERVERGDILKIFGAAMFGVVCNQMVYVVGVGYTSPADASIITTITPILTMLLAAVVLREKVTGIKMLGVAACAVGAILLITSSAKAPAALGENKILGDLLCLGSQCSVAVYFVMFKGVMSKYSPWTLMRWMFTFGALVCSPLSYIELSKINYSALSAEAIWSILYVVVMATFVSYIFLAYAQQRLKPTAVSMYNYSQPILASSLAVFWGMDHFGLLKIAAVLLVFLGVAIVTKAQSLRPRVSE